MIHSAEDGYNAIAPAYDAWKWQKIWAALEEPVIRQVVGSGMRVLDIGVGTGRNLAFIQREFEGVACTGVDVSDNMLDIARSRLTSRTQLSKGNARRIAQFDSSTFHTALLCRVGSHVENLWQVLAEAARVVLPHHQIFVSDVHPDHAYQNTHCHFSDRDIAIETYKHPLQHWDRVAHAVGLKSVFARTIIGADIAALPGIEMPTSIASVQSPVAMMRIYQKS